MEAFVQMPLEIYDLLKQDKEHLLRDIKDERESHYNDVAHAKEEINDLTEKLEQYKQYILGRNCEILCVDNHSLEYYLDINSWNYAIRYKDDLLKMGFTKQEMDEFISNKYEECVKEKKEIKTTGGE